MPKFVHILTRMCVYDVISGFQIKAAMILLPKSAKIIDLIFVSSRINNTTMHLVNYRFLMREVRKYILRLKFPYFR